MTRVVLACALVAVAAAPAAAQTEAVEVAGSAPASDADPRARALDAAFARAVERSVDAVVAPGARGAHDGVIRERVIRRARSFVAKYRVISEGEDGDVYRVRVAAWINAAALRETLTEAGVPLADPGAPAAAGERPRLVVLVHVDAAGERQATFGLTATDGGPFADALRRELRELGFELVDAGGVEIEIGATGQRLPVGDAAAVELARRVGAGGVVIVGARVAPDGRIRGTRLVGARGMAAVRVVDAADGSVVATADVESATYGAADDEAVRRAAGELGANAGRGVGRDLTRRWPAPAAAERGVLVIVRGAPGWAAVHEVWHALRAAPGVELVAPRRFEPGAVSLLAVTGLDASRLARALDGARFRDARVRVTTGRNMVFVDVTALPPGEGVP